MGKALTNSLKSEAHKWQEFRDFLVPRAEKQKGKNGVDNGKGNGSRPLPPPPLPPKVQNGKGNQQQKGPKFKFATKTEDGKSFCNFYNTGTCRRGDSCENAHMCRVQMPSGKPCGSKSHGSNGHQVGRDGVPQYVS